MGRGDGGADTPPLAGSCLTPAHGETFRGRGSTCPCAGTRHTPSPRRQPWLRQERCRLRHQQELWGEEGPSCRHSLAPAGSPGTLWCQHSRCRPGARPEGCWARGCCWSPSLGAGGAAGAGVRGLPFHMGVLGLKANSSSSARAKSHRYRCPTRLHHAARNCTAPHSYTTPHCAEAHRMATPHWTAPHCTGVRYTALNCIAWHCAAPQHVMLHRMAWHCIKPHHPVLVHCSAPLQAITLHCTALHSKAQHGCRLPCTAPPCLQSPCTAWPSTARLGTT